MMNRLTRQDIEKLIHIRNSNCISIYLPTHEKGAEVEQDPIRLKNLLKQVEQQLKEKGCKEREIDNLLKPAHDLLHDSYFWSYMDSGLVLYFNPDEFLHYQLPMPVPEYAEVSNRFYIKPLIPLLDDEHEFYILALNLKNSNLYRATRFDMQAVQTRHLPIGIDDVLKYDDPERHLQFHTGTGASRGRRSAMFHGQGSGADDRETNKSILRYAQALDKAVFDVVKKSSVPLVLVGSDHLSSLYRQANSYAHLFAESVDINPADMTEKQLHKRVWQQIEPFFVQEVQDALAQYHHLLSNNKASHSLKEIVPAAFQNRIKNLFVDINAQRPGRFDAATNTVDVQTLPHAEDLIDLTVQQTFLHHGNIYALSQDDLPHDSPVSAVFRF